VHAAGPLHLIGKEANRLDDVQAGIIGSLGEVLTDYTPVSDEWFRNYVLPVLHQYGGRQLAELADVNRRTIDRIRDGTAPRRALRDMLTQLAARTARADLAAVGVAAAVSDIAVLAAWRYYLQRPHS
jgi:hypothetical protein